MERKYFFTEYESKFINENYPIYGSKFILKNLNITSKKLDSFICSNRLFIKRNIVSIDLENKYLCYILGLI